MEYSDGSDDDAAHRDSNQTNRKRSSRACDQCRKTKSKCERTDNETCKGCAAAKTVCTFLGPSYKRGPPKGYIHAIESRWHQVESLLGALLQCPDSRVQGIISDASSSRRSRSPTLTSPSCEPTNSPAKSWGASTPVLMAPLAVWTNQWELRRKTFSHLSFEAAGRTKPRHRDREGSHEYQGRKCRPPLRVSSLYHACVFVRHSILAQGGNLAFVPTREWQENLSSRMSSGSASGSRLPSFDLSGVPLPQRRRLNGSVETMPPPPDWKDMYTLDDPEETSQREAPVEGMGALSLDEHQEVRFHGQTSGLHLLGRNNRTDSRKEGGVWKLPMARVWPPIKDPSQLIQEEDLDIELPPQHIQEHLLQLYFAYVHPVFPLVHKTRFLTEYNTSPVHSPTEGTQPSVKPEPAQKYSPLLLLSMFAISARFSEQDTPLPPKGKMWEAGGKYFLAAKNILAKVLHRSRPSTCQALLLLGYREFGIGSMEQGWIYIGMAIRMAIDLGLNCNLVHWRSGTGDRTLFSMEETQTRRQIWWACCAADRYGSMYMGRPIAIHDDDFDTPLPDDEDEQPWETFTPRGLGAHNPGITLASFRATGKLALILGSVITHIYPVRASSLTSRKASLAKLESRLDQWYLGLPENLRYESRRMAPSPQVLLLHIRYWGTVLLLHRAFIPNWKGIEPTPQNSTFELKAFDLAQGAASHISAIVTVYRDSYTLKRCSPFMTSYLLNAGIMHITTLTLRPSNPQASLGFQQCLMALKEMEIIWPSAARAYELLNGVKLGTLHTVMPPTPSHERHKRHAEDAFGQDRPSDYPPREMELLQNVDGVQDMATKLMAHMLLMDIPGVEPSTSFYAGCDWWARPNTETNQAMSSAGQTWPQFAEWPVEGRYNGEYQQQYDHFGV
ncbi:fungal-specific transcription factor domain-containing protein [Mycena amicta]|nr:fungal-specific transcription factor domain-containing protein [Mycena amicta]